MEPAPRRDAAQIAPEPDALVLGNHAPFRILTLQPPLFPGYSGSFRANFRRLLATETPAPESSAPPPPPFAPAFSWHPNLPRRRSAEAALPRCRLLRHPISVPISVRKPPRPRPSPAPPSPLSYISCVSWSPFRDSLSVSTPPLPLYFRDKSALAAEKRPKNFSPQVHSHRNPSPRALHASPIPITPPAVSWPPNPPRRRSAEAALPGCRLWRHLLAVPSPSESPRFLIRAPHRPPSPRPLFRAFRVFRGPLPMPLLPASPIPKSSSISAINRPSPLKIARKISAHKSTHSRPPSPAPPLYPISHALGTSPQFPPSYPIHPSPFPAVPTPPRPRKPLIAKETAFLSRFFPKNTLALPRRHRENFPFIFRL